MNYTRFRDMTVKKLATYLPEDYRSWKLTFETVEKVNVPLEAIRLIPPSGYGAAPTIYMKDLFAEYERMKDFDLVMAQAMEILVQGVAYGKILGTRFPSEGLEQKVVGVLINAELNKSLLEHLPHRRLLDLALIYRVIVKTSDTGVTSAMVSHQMAGHYGFSEEDLFQAAIRNTPELMPVICQEMEREFYLLTNAHKINGASALLYEGILEQVAEELEDDLYILPSSIHEVFLVPATKHNLHLLKQVVRTANQEVVTQEELLSNSIYQYDRRSGQLTIAS